MLLPAEKLLLLEFASYHAPMAKLKSERHHWWPECVSEHWADPDGGVHWLLPDGEVRKTAPGNLGVIGNGHQIKLSNRAVETHPWDTSFEPEFDRADSNFPGLIRWLDALERTDPPFSGPLGARITPVSAEDSQFTQLIECILSLAVRSPMHREQGVSLAEHFRGELPERERNALIGMNVRHSLRNAVQSIGGRGKALVLYSPEREFIYGDGFFHNITPPVQHLLSPKLLAPITPWLAVLFAKPMSYTIEPRLSTLIISAEETDALNLAVQVYSRRMLFYRSERPPITPHYAVGKHLQFRDHRNSVDQLIHAIPGVPARDASLDAFFATVRAEQAATGQ